MLLSYGCGHDSSSVSTLTYRVVRRCGRHGRADARDSAFALLLGRTVLAGHRSRRRLPVLGAAWAIST